VNQSLSDIAQENHTELQTFQSNGEGDIVSVIQNAVGDGVDFIIINPAAYTHTSVAIRDAFLATRIPFIEVHLSNVHARESFRQQSYLSDIANGVICGFGKNSYLMALGAAIHQCKPSKK
jgi:3-dehydroquinate dehydratase-2